MTGEVWHVELNVAVVGTFALLGVSEHVDKILPDLDALVFVQVQIADCEMNAGLEGLVKGRNAVGSQDEDAVVVFKHVEEHCGEINDMTLRGKQAPSKLRNQGRVTGQCIEVMYNYLKLWRSASGWEPFSPPKRHQLHRAAQL